MSFHLKFSILFSTTISIFLSTSARSRQKNEGKTGNESEKNNWNFLSSTGERKKAQKFAFFVSCDLMQRMEQQWLKLRRKIALLSFSNKLPAKHLSMREIWISKSSHESQWQLVTNFNGNKSRKYFNYDEIALTPWPFLSWDSLHFVANVTGEESSIKSSRNS